MTTLSVPSVQAWVVSSAPVNDNPKTPHRYNLEGPAPEFVEFSAFGTPGIKTGSCVQVQAAKNQAGREFLRIYNVLSEGNGTYTRPAVEEPEEEDFIPDFTEGELDEPTEPEEEVAVAPQEEDPTPAPALEEPAAPVEEEETPAPKTRRRRAKKADPEQTTDAPTETAPEEPVAESVSSDRFSRKVETMTKAYIQIHNEIKAAGIEPTHEIVFSILHTLR